ncbi:MAG: hypothetical protein AAF587_16725 [Bacteroidota bacterium]
MKYHDPTTSASDSIQIGLDLKKLKFLMPEIFSLSQRIKYWLRRFGFSSYIEQISEHISFGDSQGAVVVSTSPLLIAAYNEDIDCVIMLKYEKKIQKRYQFFEGDRLICVNTFGRWEEMQSDLIPGKRNSGSWNSVHPIVADLVSSDQAPIQRRKDQIGEQGFAYIEQLGREYLIKKPQVFRDGKPIYASMEA